MSRRKQVQPARLVATSEALNGDNCESPNLSSQGNRNLLIALNAIDASGAEKAPTAASSNIIGKVTATTVWPEMCSSMPTGCAKRVKKSRSNFNSSPARRCNGNDSVDKAEAAEEGEEDTGTLRQATKVSFKLQLNGQPKENGRQFKTVQNGNLKFYSPIFASGLQEEVVKSSLNNYFTQNVGFDTLSKMVPNVALMPVAYTDSGGIQVLGKPQALIPVAVPRGSKFQAPPLTLEAGWLNGVQLACDAVPVVSVKKMPTPFYLPLTLDTTSPLTLGCLSTLAPFAQVNNSNAQEPCVVGAQLVREPSSGNAFLWTAKHLADQQEKRPAVSNNPSDQSSRSSSRGSLASPTAGGATSEPPPPLPVISQDRVSSVTSPLNNVGAPSCSSSSSSSSKVMSKNCICLQCGISFFSAKTLEAHQQFYCKVGQKLRDEAMASAPKSLDIGASMTCQYCELTTTNIQYLWSHIKTKHLANKAYLCIICGYRGLTLRGMKSHLRISHVTNTPVDLSDEHALMLCVPVELAGSLLFDQRTSGDKAAPVKDESVVGDWCSSTVGDPVVEHPLNLEEGNNLANAKGAKKPKREPSDRSTEAQVLVKCRLCGGCFQDQPGYNGHGCKRKEALVSAQDAVSSTSASLTSQLDNNDPDGWMAYQCSACNYSNGAMENLERHMAKVHRHL